MTMFDIIFTLFISTFLVATLCTLCIILTKKERKGNERN